MKKVLRKSNLVAGLLVLIVVCLGIVLAGDVVVKEGTMTADEMMADKITADEMTSDLFNDRSLVGYWHFNGTAMDSWRNENDGTFMGGANAEKGVLELDGSGDYVRCDDHQSLDLQNDFSISLWFEAYSLGIPGIIVCKGIDPAWNTNGAYTILCVPSNGEVAFYVRNSADTGFGYAVTAIPLDEWVHVVGTFSSNGDVKIYKNGVFIDSGNLGDTTINTNDGRLGMGADGDGGTTFEGSIEDLMIFDKVLEDWEIRQLYRNLNKYGHFNELTISGDLDATGTVTMGKLVIPTRSTTGDPASPVEGQIYTNTADNKVRVYSDGAWRDLASW